MIKRQQQKYGREFIFRGANIDAIETARNFGIDESRAANFVNDELGINIMYEAQCNLMSDLRNNRVNERKWKENIDSDYAMRGNRSREVMCSSCLSMIGGCLAWIFLAFLLIYEIFFR